MDPTTQYWIGPTGASGPNFLGVTGAVTGPAFFGVTGAPSPTGPTGINDNVSYLYNRCRAEMVGASDALIRTAVYDVFHEFFNDSSSWLEAIPGILWPGVRIYFLQPGNPQSLGDPFPTGRIIRLAGIQDLNSFPVSGQMPMPPELTLQFAPSNQQSVFVTVIKSVDIPNTISGLPTAPVWLVPQYEPFLMAGVKGKLMLQPNRPYSNVPMGQGQYQYFRQGVNMARVSAMRRNTWGGQAWAFPQSASTRSQRGWVVTAGGARWF